MYAYLSSEAMLYLFGNNGVKKDKFLSNRFLLAMLTAGISIFQNNMLILFFLD